MNELKSQALTNLLTKPLVPESQLLRSATERRHREEAFDKAQAPSSLLFQQRMKAQSHSILKSPTVKPSKPGLEGPAKPGAARRSWSRPPSSGRHTALRSFPRTAADWPRRPALLFQSRNGPKAFAAKISQVTATLSFVAWPL